MKICAFRAKSLFWSDPLQRPWYGYYGSSRWQRSKGRLPEEDKKFMKALVKQSIKMEIKKEDRNIKAANRHGFSVLIFEVSPSV